jgi:hypothetical protein
MSLYWSPQISVWLSDKILSGQYVIDEEQHYRLMFLAYIGYAAAVTISVIHAVCVLLKWQK